MICQTWSNLLEYNAIHSRSLFIVYVFHIFVHEKCHNFFLQNKAPKVSGVLVIKYGAVPNNAIIFFPNPHKNTILLARQWKICGVVCGFKLIYILLQSLHWCLQYQVILDRVITALYHTFGNHITFSKCHKHSATNLLILFRYGIFSIK